MVGFSVKLLLGRMQLGVDDRVTNPPLAFMSKASIFHAPAGTQNSDRAVVQTAGHGQGQWRVSGRTTDTPSLIISNPLALPI